MKKVKLMLLLTALTLSTVGCSKEGSSWISSDGTNIYINDKVAKLTEFDGTKGVYKVEGDLIYAEYKPCVAEVRDCVENRQGVHEADLSEFKKAKYFDAYIDSFSCMHAPLGEDTTREAKFTTEDKDLAPLNTVRGEIYDTMMGLKFGPITESVFAGCIKVKSDGQSLIVRNTDITIPGVLTVGKGTKECTQQVNIGEITCMKYESNNFDFYQYGDNLIKAAKGTNIENYIELLQLG